MLTSNRLKSFQSFPPAPALDSSTGRPLLPTPPHAPQPIPAKRKRAPPSSETKPKKVPSTRRALSCLPCRRHKLKCDRHVPCHSCIRYRREDLCRKHPAPSSLLEGTCGIPKGPADPVPTVWSHSPSTQMFPPHANVNHTAPPAVPSFPRTDTFNPPSLTVRESVATAPQVANVGGPMAAPTVAPTQQSQPHNDLTQHLAGTTVLPRSLPFITSICQEPSRQAEFASFWKIQLTSYLPAQYQCDLLVTYYMEHIDWVYHAIHLPSFRKEYASFWNTNVQDVNLLWLSLLYAIISCSAIYVPLHLAQTAGLDQMNIRKKAHQWHSASRQALHAGGFESRPALVQLETFLVTQLYWLATKNAEAMNSCLGQAVRNAQALGLDKDLPGRTPLIHTPPSRVPFPSHCNDVDVTETTVDPKPLDEPTDMSANIFRAEIFIIFRKLFENDAELLSSYEHVKSIDDQIEHLMASFPWYLQINANRECAMLPEHLEFIAWQHHLLHSCICMQRIRMNRPFIHTRTGQSWDVCAKAANEVLSVYHCLRNRNVEEFRKSQKFLIQGYQIFSAAVALAAFLLVERSFPADNIRKDIEVVISDLGYTDTQIPTAADGTKILISMLEMHDRRELHEPVEPETLVSEISSVFGGELTTRKYLKRCDIGYVLNDDPGTATTISLAEQNGRRKSDQSMASTYAQVPQPLRTGMGVVPSVPTMIPDLLDPTMYNVGTQFDFGFDSMLSTLEWNFLLPNLEFHQ
ncbi:hypothetical protein PRK78_007504 [Emydomyces testavorans]|uniref:C6 finger domain transcription factor nscR n=1 Tax=Emydomyces testavorans TaxID=2070801 RepID=A0AAF0DNB6_9EURO|nr:hypothetical protein PRK78_007504 [Emydomyces testavorans]